jgi:hypothetical protein
MLNHVFSNISDTVKPVYNNHFRDYKFVAVLTGGRCSKVGLCYKDLNRDSKMVVSVGRWSLFGGGR